MHISQYAYTYVRPSVYLSHSTNMREKINNLQGHTSKKVRDERDREVVTISHCHRNNIIFYRPCQLNVPR